jgi:SanA protein
MIEVVFIKINIFIDRKKSETPKYSMFNKIFVFWYPSTRMYMRKYRKFIYLLIVAVTLPVIFLITCNVLIIKTTKNELYTNIDQLPVNDIGLVLGTSKYTVGGINLYYKYRIEAAAELYFKGKIRHIIVSGDNHVNGYNEPEQMKESLIKLGVPAEKITCDYAGLRTLDSVVRLKKIFMTKKATIISQKFHLQRALFIAKFYKIDAVGYCSRDVGVRYNKTTSIRELLARSKAILDLYVLGTKPKHLGPEIKINIQ